VIGHGYGGHPKFLHALAQLFDITSAIEQGIVGVQVQVNELGHWDLWVSLTHTRPRKGVEGCGGLWDSDFGHIGSLPKRASTEKAVYE
jgi:hypothetical protein